MLFPTTWALNPNLVSAFVPSTFNMQQRPSSNIQQRQLHSVEQRSSSNMEQRRSSSSGDSLPEYTAVDGNTPPAYLMEAVPKPPTRPKQAHTHLPRDETRSRASAPGLADDYVHMQAGVNFDVEANMSAANVRVLSSLHDLYSYAIVQADQLAPRTEDNLNVVNNVPARLRITGLDLCANLVLLTAVIFWPCNFVLKLSGDLCHSTVSKVVFCGVPATALFIIWLAMFQEKGYWATSRQGRTERQHKVVRMNRLVAMLLMTLTTVVLLWQVTFWICHDGCGKRVGDGKNCINNDPIWPF